jgi:ATP-dependent Lhr-like helicase
MSEEAFALLHPGVQRAIYEMGWKEIREVQQEAIREVYGTDNHLLVCAQTAGGKTEAAFLPVISKLADEPRNSVQAIYIGPLKALINDQFRRLENLCERLEIPVHRWHGDVPGNQKKKLREEPGGGSVDYARIAGVELCQFWRRRAASLSPRVVCGDRRDALVPGQ